MKLLKNNEKRAKNVILVFKIIIGYFFVMPFLNYYEYNSIKRIAQGEEFLEESKLIFEIIDYSTLIISSILALICAIFFILWFRRAYYNLSQLVLNVSYSDGWAAGAWFVPIVNLFRPYKIMKELYEKTESLFIKKNIKFESDFKSNSVLIWWIFWIASYITGNIVYHFEKSDNYSIEDLQNILIFYTIENVFTIIAAVFAIKVIKNYALSEPLLHKIEGDEKDIV